jgi:uncharacterized membrane protein YeaQ/YmgE (transglycosylase-associated protein family)
MEILTTLILGGLTGWLASKIMKTDAQMGVLANIFVGLVGSALGSWAAGLLGFAAFGLAARIIVAIGGAALLIVVLRALKVLK